MSRPIGNLNKATVRKMMEMGEPVSLRLYESSVISQQQNVPSQPKGISQNYQVAYTPMVTTPENFVTTVSAPLIGQRGQGRIMPGSPAFDRTPEQVKKILGSGRTGTINYGGYFHEEYFLPLVGRNAALIYDEMRRSDYQVGAVLRHIYNKIKGANYYFQAPDSEDPKWEPMIELLEQALFHRTNKNWSETLQDIISFIPFGYSLFEPTWKEESFDCGEGNRTYWIPKSLGYRSQKTIWKWVIVDDKLWSVQQIAWGDDSVMVDIPGPDCLAFTLDKEGNNYEGISMLRQAYGPWFRKQMYHTMNGIGVERASIGFLDVEVPILRMGTEEMAMLDEALAMYSTGQTPYLRRPEGFKINFQKVEFESEAIQKAIRMEDANIAKSMMTEFIELGLTNVGSKAVAAPKIDEFTEALRAIAKIVCDGLNPLIKEIIDMNFGEQNEYPVLMYTGIDKKASLDFAQQILTLYQTMGLDMDASMKEFIRETWDFPEKENYEDAMDPQSPENKSNDNGAPTAEELAQEKKEHGATIQKVIDDTKNGNEPNVDSVIQQIAAAHHTKKKPTFPTSGAMIPAPQTKKKLNEHWKHKFLNETNPYLKNRIDQCNQFIKGSIENYVIPTYISNLKKIGVNNLHGTILPKQGKVQDELKDLLTNVAKKGRKSVNQELEKLKKKRKLAEGDDEEDTIDEALDMLVINTSKTFVGQLYNGLLGAAADAVEENKGMSDDVVIEAVRQAMLNYVDNSNNCGGGNVVPLTYSDTRDLIMQRNQRYIKAYVWVAMWVNTCEDCADLDGATYDNWEDIPSRPMHDHCMCEVHAEGYDDEEDVIE